MSWRPLGASWVVAGLWGAERLARPVQSCRVMSRMSLVLLAAMAGGCLESGDGIVMVDERFEDCVECRWTIDGSVAQVTTIHPGEHGLRFLTTTSMAMPVSVTIWDELSDGHWLEYSTDCGGGPEVWNEPDGAGGWHVFARIPMVAEGAPGPFERAYANLPPISAGEYTAATISGLTVFVDDPQGPCAIDNLRLIQPEPEYY